MTTALASTRFTRAYDRAQASSRKIWQIGPTTYRCHSFDPEKPDTWYILRVTPRGIDCSCPSYSKICKHAVKLSKRLRREHSTETLSEWFSFADTATDDDFEQAIVEALPERTPDYGSLYEDHIREIERQQWQEYLDLDPHQLPVEWPEPPLLTEEDCYERARIEVAKHSYPREEVLLDGKPMPGRGLGGTRLEDLYD